MYIGGISYFSSGSGKRPLGGVCPEAAASPDSKTNQIKKRVVDTIKHLKLKKGDRISEHTRGVHQIFPTQTGHGRFKHHRAIPHCSECTTLRRDPRLPPFSLSHRCVATFSAILLRQPV